MLTFMEPDSKVLFEEYKYTKKMFDAINISYRQIFESYIQLLIEKYYSYKMNNDENIVDHISKMNVLAKELAIVGNAIYYRKEYKFLQFYIVFQTLRN